MLHVALITVHAVAGAVGFIAGIVLVRRPRAAGCYLGSLVVMAGALLLAVVEQFGRLEAGVQALFVGLTVLAALVVAQGVRAVRLNRSTTLADRRRRWDAIGFTLVALFAAYVVIQVMELGAPLWAILGSVAAASLLGHVVLRRTTRRALAVTAVRRGRRFPA